MPGRPSPADRTSSWSWSAAFRSPNIVTRSKATPKERLELFKTVCDAVQHAHQKGIIHRDIKPSNVLVTQVSAKPVVKVIDFGLAKATSGQKLTDKTVYTGFMKLMGTPVYMSPEQAGLSGLDVDTRSDVYSLGILLYELLTGTTPLDRTEIQKQAYEELCRQIREVEAPKPSARVSTLQPAERSTIALHRQVEPAKLRQVFDGDLDVVVLKALEKDRERRYESPKELAADVDRFLADQPVEAVPPSSWYWARKYFRRHRLAILTAAAFVASLIAATAISSWQAIRANKAVGIAEAAERKAVDSEQVAASARDKQQQTAEERRRLLYASNMQLADQIWNSPNGDLRNIESLLMAWMPVGGSEDLREFSWRYQWARLYSNAAVTARETTGAAVSSAGNLLIANASGLHEWNASGTESTTLWSSDATEVTFSPDGRWAAIVLEKDIQLVELTTGRSVIDIPHAHCSFSARGELLLAWTAETDQAQAWNLSAAEPIEIEAFDFGDTAGLVSGSSSIHLSGDARSFLFRGYPGYDAVTMFAADENQTVAWLHRNAARSCTWSPNGQIMASGNSTGVVFLRFRSDYRVKSTISAHGKSVQVLRFNADGTRLAVGGSDGTIDLWDTSALILMGVGNKSIPTWAEPRLLRTIKAHLSGGIESLSFSADGAKLASYANGVSKLWNVEQEEGRYEVAKFGEDLISGRLGVFLTDAELGVTVQRIDPQYHEVVSGDIRVGDKIVKVSDDARGDLADIGSKRAAEVEQSLWGPYQSTVRLTVEDENGEPNDVELRRIRKMDPRTERICFSPDGTTVAISGGRLGATSLNLATGRSRRYPQISNNVAISHDSRLLAMDGKAGILIWDLVKDQEYGRLSGIGGQGGSLAFSPDGRFLAIGTAYPYNWTPRRSDLKVWRVSNLEEVGRSPLFTNTHVLSGITFTPDSSELIATDHAGIVRVWDTSTWNLKDQQFVTGQYSSALAISRDGELLATDANGQVDLWDVPTGEKLHPLSGTRAWALAFSRDGKTLASGGPNHNVILWDVATAMPLRTFHSHADAVKGVAFSPDGNTLATVGDEGVLRLWKAAPFDQIETHPQTLEAMYRLGELRNREDRCVEAEAILVSLLQRQRKQLPTGHSDIERTKSQIALALKGQNRLPAVTRQPESVEAKTGDSVRLHAEVKAGEWSLQWFLNGQPIDGATEAELTVQLGDEDYGAYHLEAAPADRDDVSPVRSDVAFVVEPLPAKSNGLRWEVYNDISDYGVEGLKASKKFPDQPDSTQVIDSFEIPSNAGDHYGGQVTGWLIPPVTGEYVFYLCCDDQGQLFLSESESPDGERLIAFRERWTRKRMWQSTQATSAPIYLQRGKRYSIRALFKAGTHGDHLGVAWRIPHQSPPKNGDPPIRGMFLQRRLE